ncbi:MAG: hypothetical protein RIB03_02675 [Henriciella sp.]|uniref:hypothetical protein n=1 Tax=Henriciella sp. TaxID=1968823 RepID=UPI0032EBFAEB
MIVRITSVVAACLLTSACQTASGRAPAHLQTADEATLSRVKAVLSKAVGRAQIKLGPEDLTESSTVSVLPPPLGEHETHSTAMPTVFDLVTNGGDCYLIARESGRSYRLDGVDCEAVEG